MHPDIVQIAREQHSPWQHTCPDGHVSQSVSPVVQMPFPQRSPAMQRVSQSPQ
jgi:hypothetical protein